MRYKTLKDATFTPWQPSTWPDPGSDFAVLLPIIQKILTETLIDEINNVINDAHKAHGNLEHRGHVIGLSLFCAVEAVAQYAFDKNSYEQYIRQFFPGDYSPYANAIWKSFRNSSAHSWNLFAAGMWPGNEVVQEYNGAVNFGLLNFYEALKQSVDNFLAFLPTNKTMQYTCTKRYNSLRKRARP